jgi:chemotaxis protein methyltransferase CheR
MIVRKRKWTTQMYHPILAKVARFQVLGKSPVGFYLRLNKRIWERLPSRVRSLYPVRSYGTWLHSLVRLIASRQQYFGTFFLRNRPLLELMRRLAGQKCHGAALRLAVLGCSIGAEVYSILWTIRSARPDLKVLLEAVDISKQMLSLAQRGIYSPGISQFVGASIFDRLTQAEMAEIFDWEADRATIKSWLREGITWRVADAADPELMNVLGPQDMVVASNFLCHMARADAEMCLGNIARLVSPGGYLFVSGVDLDLRTKIAIDLGWQPVTELIAEIHDGDWSVRADWPCEWWGLEPLNRNRHDWQTRYAAAFRIGSHERR